ncbi:hypothetical protein [Pseudogracilibacillus auburnensis]|uniref:hypothetical protein n=1 Tax=Pseudogracilibacillus auburnensis TaxID=1494959 RepID=UPI001A95C693|nr:hypothetical protein [Pseudogracilibacillus auburnensis]MBO1005905.1 hypothetical protein [Pseudogracilibacillus auburnensis]
MDRKTFEVLSFKKQLEYVNQRSGMTVKQISEEIKGMPPSSLSKTFAEKGYRRVKGIYVKKEQIPQLISSKEDPLQELLRYKDEIISMVLEKQHYQSIQFDFSFLEQYEKQNKKTITFDLPEEMANQFNSLVAKKGYKKQAVWNLLVYSFLQNHQ